MIIYNLIVLTKKPHLTKQPLHVLFSILIVINASIFTTLQVCVIDTCAVDRVLSVTNRRYLYLLTKLFDKNNCRLKLQYNMWKRMAYQKNVSTCSCTSNRFEIITNHQLTTYVVTATSKLKNCCKYILERHGMF